MKKILFSDAYGLTAAVLSGRKTQTRRIVPQSFFTLFWDTRDNSLVVENSDGDFIDIKHTKFAAYKVGEVVAVAQAYKDVACGALFDDLKEAYRTEPTKLAGWANKLFVHANLMPHQVRITNVRVEQLNDITEADCMAEGIYQDECTGHFNGYAFEISKDQHGNVLAKKWYETARKAYAALIDRISGRGTWESNPYVFVYDFELVK